MDAPALYDLSPVLRMALLAIALAAGPLAWWRLRSRGTSAPTRLRKLTWLTLFLTFDLVLFGAFTRLSDSGLGCPDWPGCYGHASPIGAQASIQAEQNLRPTGAVTHGKAWVEMVHRYLAATVGVLIAAMAAASWVASRRERLQFSPWWATATLVWVCVQGAFGALTVTMKLYPAIVTLHLLGGIGLLALLAAQSQAFEAPPLLLGTRLLRAVGWVTALSLVQVLLGAWVSSNYAVLACSEFPTCQGSWWPAMDFAHGFSIRRELGETTGGEYLQFAALTAIHYVHRLAAYVVLVSLLWLAWRLKATGDAALKPWAAALAGLAAWQLASGLSNVVLGWPLAAALAHTGGAAVLMAVLTALLVRAAQSRRAAPVALGLGRGPRMAS